MWLWSCLLPMAALGGCYASHERGATEALCELPSAPSSCDGARATVPMGVCRDERGQVLAFAVGVGLARCEASGGSLTLQPCAEGHEGTHAVRCEGAPASGPLVFSWWPTRPPFVEVAFDPAPGRCEVRPEAEAAGPWEALRGIDEVCTDVAPSCGAPVVIDLVVRGSDGCGGSRFVERCRAEVRGAEIVLVAESADAQLDTCATVIGDRVARCALPPLPPGRYALVDDEARALGAIDVDAGGGGAGGRVCTDVL